MLEILQKPYPFDGYKTQIRNILWGGVFVFLFLALIKPFGMQPGNVGMATFLLVCAAFGAVTSLVMAITTFALYLLPNIFNETNWVVWKEIVVNVLVIGLIGTGNLLLATILFGNQFTLENFLQWQWMTLVIGLFPVLITVLTKQNRLQKKYGQEAQLLNNKIHDTKAKSKHDLLKLVGENQGETLELHLDEFLYCESSANYVTIYFLKENNLQKEMLRLSLKGVEEQVKNYPDLFRCHKTFLVNLKKVKEVSGNAQGYKLHFEEIENLVPVSRSLNQKINELFYSEG
ncbi:MAG: LytTR family DNA-binding domain-containing protein [Saprospiraceae bacterium]